MEWAQLQFTTHGWSRSFPALDGPRTLVLVFDTGGGCRLHNQTMTLTSFQER